MPWTAMADRGVRGNRTQNAGLFDVDSAFIYSAVTNNPTTTPQCVPAPVLRDSAPQAHCTLVPAILVRKHRRSRQ